MDMPFPIIKMPPSCSHINYKMVVRHKREEKCDIDGKLYIQCLTRYEIHCKCGKKMASRWFVDSDENLHQIEIREIISKNLLKEWEADNA